MKFLCLTASIFLFMLHVDSAHAQIRSAATADYRNTSPSAPAMQSWYQYDIEDSFALGLAYDEDGAVGMTVIYDAWLIEAMLNDSDVGSGWKFKGGPVFTVTGSRDLNLNLYGVGGYGFFDDYSGSAGDTSGLLLEAGAILGADLDFSEIGIGAGYVFDMGLEENYVNFRALLVFGY